MGSAKKKLERKGQKKTTPLTLLNRRAFHEFEIIDTYIAGMMLTGTEVKVLRLGRGQLGEAFIKICKAGTVKLYGCTIPLYEFGNRYNHDATRVRTLLLNRKEIMRWKAKTEQERLTIIPLKLFFKGSWAKLEIALAKRKLLHDKRKQLKELSIGREMQRDLKNLR